MRGSRGRKVKPDSKVEVILEDGRRVQLSQRQKQLYEFCNGLGKLPREIIERILSGLPKRSLLALKYVKTLRPVAFALVHQTYWLSSKKDLVQSALIVAGIGSAIRTFGYHGHEANYDFLAEILRPESLPPIRDFTLSTCHDQPAIPTKHAKILVERLGSLPYLQSLDIHDGGNNVGQLLPETAYDTIRYLPSLHEKERSSLFPSLQAMRLQNPSAALTAYLLSERCRLQSLKRLALTNAHGYIYADHFPRNLIALEICSCLKIGYAHLLQLLRASQDTIESVYFDDGCESRSLDFVSAPVLECPRLKSMAVQERDYCCDGCRNVNRKDDEMATVVPYWARTSIGFLSRLVAPDLETLGIGGLLMEPWTDALQSLVESRKESKLRSILCRHVVPIEPGPLPVAEEAEHGEEIRAQLLLKNNFDLASGLLQDTGIDLLCIGQEDYEEYFTDAFYGQVHR